MLFWNVCNAITQCHGMQCNGMLWNEYVCMNSHMGRHFQCSHMLPSASRYVCTRKSASQRVVLQPRARPVGFLAFLPDGSSWGNTWNICIWTLWVGNWGAPVVCHFFPNENGCLQPWGWYIPFGWQSYISLGHIQVEPSMLAFVQITMFAFTSHRNR